MINVELFEPARYVLLVLFYVLICFCLGCWNHGEIKGTIKGEMKGEIDVEIDGNDTFFMFFASFCKTIEIPLVISTF